MAIDKILQGSAFSPNDVRNMTAAYEAALVLLSLDDRDPITERIAEKIIAIAQSGDYNAAHICARAINALGLVKPPRSSFRWREALLLLVIGAYCGYVFAQMIRV